MLFSSLKRSDQRRWAQLYLNGLLTLDGRKTMRRIAAMEAKPAIEQSLQQFISQSPWDWVAVRRSLACYLEQMIRPVALVVEPVLIPKSGEHSVGVERRFVKRLGRLSNCQEAVGIWLASEHESYPIDWHMAIPDSWIDDPVKRRRAGIPETIGSRTIEECVIGAVVDILESWGLRRWPVVMDVRAFDPGRLVFELSARRIPFVLRVDGTVPVSPADPRVPFGAGRRMQGSQLVDAMRDLSQPVMPAGARPGLHRPAFAVSARVETPFRPSRPLREEDGGTLQLLGAWTGGGRASDFWLSNITRLAPAALYCLARTADHVARDRVEVTDRVGLRDFEGRSFRGWHHHVTLVSAAHGFALLTAGNAGPRSAAAPVPPQAPRVPLRGG
ncbi:IS701 family transposase, partial [Planomonospora algeriensis]